MKKTAFTLVELLVVVSIIIILIGLTSSGVLVAIKKAKQSRAKTEIMNILTAVKLYHSEVGFLPGQISEKYLGKQLSKEDTYGITGDTILRFGPYYEFKDSNCTGTTPNRNLVDPWDKNYIYVKAGDEDKATASCKTTVGNGFSVVYSLGQDGVDNTPDDIGTWQ